MAHVPWLFCGRRVGGGGVGRTDESAFISPVGCVLTSCGGGLNAEVVCKWKLVTGEGRDKMRVMKTYVLQLRGAPRSPFAGFVHCHLLRAGNSS